MLSMVSSVYKWSFILLLAVVLTSARPAPPHPFHVSVVEIEHNATDKTLEISCKLFTDDFETTLAKNYNARVDLTNPPNKAAMDSLVKKYVMGHLSIRPNGKPGSMVYVGFETDSDGTYAYFEIDNITTALSKVDITNTIFFDRFDDQVSIMHVKENGNRKSTKLNYPDKEASISF